MDLYENIVNNSPVIIWVTGADAECIYLSNQWYDFTGQTTQTALGSGWMDALHVDDIKYRTLITEAHLSKTSFQFEYRLKNKSGHYKWHLNCGTPQFDEMGTFTGYIGSIIDIHDRKHSEEQLRKSEEHYKNYAEAMPQMAFIADARGNIIYYNQRWYAFVQGIEGTEGWGWKDKQILHPDDLQQTIDRWKYSLETGKPYEMEYRIRRYDGEYLWHLGRAIPVCDNTGNITLWTGTNTDIHKWKVTEAALKKSEQSLKESDLRYHTALEHSPIVFAWIDTNLRYEWILNPHPDFDPGEIIGKRDDEVANNPGVDALMRLKRSALDNGIQEREMITFGLSDGPRTYDITATPLFDDNKNTIGIITASLDVTRQKQVERELKMVNTDLDTFVYTASHQLKAPTLNLEGLILHLKNLSNNGADISKLIMYMEESVQRLKSTISDLTEVARVQKLQAEDIEDISLQEVFIKLKKSMQAEIEESGANIGTDFSRLSSFMFSKTNFETIAYNLLSNSIKYKFPARTPIIHVKAEKTDEYVIVSFEDNGLGIKEQNKEKIFDLFKRFHTHTTGTGMGLYIVKRIVENAGGKIEVESSINNGSIFRLYFPL
jgi:PAS domain S-box-containing protein